MSLNTKEYNQAYYQKNKDKITKKHREWRDANKEYSKKAQQEWRVKNKGAIQQYRKQYNKEYYSKIKSLKNGNCPHCGEKL